MTSGARRRIRGFESPFSLPLIRAMKPYLDRVLADLSQLRDQREHLDAVANRAPRPNDDFASRRRRRFAQIDRDKLDREIDAATTELLALGVTLADTGSLTLLFPCQIDHRRAFFIWTEGEDRPTRFRFRGDKRLFPIPERWHLIATDRPRAYLR